MAKRSFYKQSTAVEAVSTSTVLEVEKPTRFIHITTQKINLLQPARWGLWLFFTGISSIVIFFAAIMIMGLWYLQTFQQTAQTDIFPIIKYVWAQRQTNVFSSKKMVSFLLLGLDQSKHQRENSILTDTIALVTLNDRGQVYMISIPRDLWIESLKTKINALYYYGQQNNKDDGVMLVSSVVTEITGIPIDYYLVVNMDSVKNVVDALGGINVDVQRSFEDREFPREIDVTSKDPAILYETVSFTQGKQHFDGDTALKYIRSRHSDDEIEGTTEGREMRQQQILQALLVKTKDIGLLSNPQLMGSLYKIWKQEITNNIDDTFLALLALNLRHKPITIKQLAIPIKTADQDGVIFHPTHGPANQWVFAPIDSSWIPLQSWLASQISAPN